MEHTRRPSRGVIALAGAVVAAVVWAAWPWISHIL